MQLNIRIEYIRGAWAFEKIPSFLRSHQVTRHRSLKEEEVWTSEYRSLAEARESIARYLEEYNHDRLHRGVENRTPNEAFLSFAVLTKNEALNV